MIKINLEEIAGFKSAIKAMRNPMDSWGFSDSHLQNVVDDLGQHEEFVLGDKDLNLMQKLFKAGVEHRTYARMLQVWVTIDAPMYWWKEMDRYTVGKTQVSCSTMHKIHSKRLTLDDFSTEHLISESVKVLQETIQALNDIRNIYSDFDYLYEEELISPDLTCKKDVWWQMIQLLPSSYNQKRTVNLNYEVCMKIWKERHDHKLDEWKTLCDFILTLPYMKEIMGVE